MSICIVDSTDCCDEFSKIDSCLSCSFSIKGGNNKLVCPTLADKGNCEECSLNRGYYSVKRVTR